MTIKKLEAQILKVVVENFQANLFSVKISFPLLIKLFLLDHYKKIFISFVSFFVILQSKWILLRVT